jgi:hypothetical protein
MKDFINALSIAKTLGFAWVFFATLYFLFSLAYPFVVQNTQNTAIQGAYQNGQVSGYTTAFTQLGQVLDEQIKGGCKQAVPVNVGSGLTLGVVNVACLQAQTGATLPQDVQVSPTKQTPPRR